MMYQQKNEPTTQIQANHLKLYGLNFSPYADDQSPIEESPVPSKAQIRRRLEMIAPLTNRIRIFNSTGICQDVVQIAVELGFEVSLGAWISHDKAENEEVLEALIDQAKHPQIHTLVVGNEVMMRQELPLSELLAMIKRVKQAFPEKIVTTAEVLQSYRDYPEIISQVDLVYANIHPYFAHIPIACAFDNLRQQYEILTGIAGEKPVLISETGWPCADGKEAGQFMEKFIQWTSAHPIPYYYFSAFDEPWKAGDEGPWGAYFGLWQNDEQLKSGYQSVIYREEVAAT